MTACKKSGSQRGMSLMEVVAALMILAFLAFILLPNLLSTDTATLGSQAQSLAADVRRAQTMAMSTGTSVCLRRISSSQYGIYSTTKPAGTTQCTETVLVNPTTGASTPLVKKDPLTGQDAIYSLSQGATFAGDSSVIFNSLGKAVTGANFYLQTQDQYRAITVDAATGLVTVSAQNLSLPLPQSQP